jgi:hypothetical protein
MITNTGLLIGPFVGIAFLIAGVMLRNRTLARGSATTIGLGGLLFLAAELYGVLTLKPFVGRAYDEQWHAQVATVEGLAMAGLVLCGAGLLWLAMQSAKTVHAP